MTEIIDKLLCSIDALHKVSAGICKQGSDNSLTRFILRMCIKPEYYYGIVNVIADGISMENICYPGVFTVNYNGQCYNVADMHVNQLLFETFNEFENEFVGEVFIEPGLLLYEHGIGIDTYGHYFVAPKQNTTEGIVDLHKFMIKMKNLGRLEEGCSICGVCTR
jgi:hypothetical protein